MMRRLERILGWAAIPNLTVWIIAVQVCAYIALRAPMRGLDQDLMLERLMLLPERVLAGEWWRLASFIFLPPFGNLLFDFFAFWLFYIMGTSLEREWGTFRFNVFVWIWWLATVGVAMTTGLIASNHGLGLGVFLAFAWLNPEFTMLIFFILPVKIRYLAWLSWLFIVISLATGPVASRLAALASVANFLLFFGTEVWDWVRSGSRRMQRVARKTSQTAAPYTHKCTTCGLTDRDAPNIEFRYCSRCAGQLCYCSDHLRTHEHVLDPQPVSR
jgi:hypothetical protein